MDFKARDPITPTDVNSHPYSSIQPTHIQNEPLSIKHRKEAFVSGLTGGSISEIYICTLVAISSYITWSILQSRFAYFAGSTTNNRRAFFSIPTIVDVALNWITSLLSITIYSSAPLLLNFFILIPGIFVFFYNAKDGHLTSQKHHRNDTQHGEKNIKPQEQMDYRPNIFNNDIKVPERIQKRRAESTKSNVNQDLNTTEEFEREYRRKIDMEYIKQYLPRLPFLSVYRGQMMIITCLAILAVDFPIFPRRFAKAETWGTSLMDMGVGSFVFSMGLVFARSTLLSNFNQQSDVVSHTDKETSIYLSPSFFRRILNSFRQVFSVLALGILRLLFVKKLDYQEHVTEYGIHWNFFMTLGFLPPIVTLLETISPPTNCKKGFSIPTLFLAIIIAIFYEYSLDRLGLTAYIVTAPRVDIVSQNKEGICSFVGYLAIFLLGKATGYYTLPSVTSFRTLLYPQTRSDYLNTQKISASPDKRNTGRKRRIIILLAQSGLFHILFFITRKYFRLQVSRRFANLPYVLWIGSYNTLNLALCALVELLAFETPNKYSYQTMVPDSVDSVNASGLFIFLLANISTGLINMSVNTIDSSPSKAIAILSAYALFLYTVGTFLKRNEIVIRL